MTLVPRALAMCRYSSPRRFQPGRRSVRVVARRAPEASPPARDELREADGRAILQIWPDRLQSEREPGACDADGKRGRRLSRHGGQGGIEEPQLLEHAMPGDLDRTAHPLPP